jgi:hypothetical protein
MLFPGIPIILLASTFRIPSEGKLENLRNSKAMGIYKLQNVILRVWVSTRYRKVSFPDKKILPLKSKSEIEGKFQLNPKLEKFNEHIECSNALSNALPKITVVKKPQIAANVFLLRFPGFVIN